jgi:hypothetical protein
MNASPRKPGRSSSPSPSPQDLRRDIELTREQLGGTVEAIADKADVPARVKATVQETADTVRATADQVTAQAATVAQNVGEQVREGVEVLHAKAEDATEKAKNLTGQAVAALPPAVWPRIEQMMAAVRRRPVPAAVTAVLVVLVLRRLLVRRNGE